MVRLSILRMILYFLIGALSGVSMGIVGVGAGMLTIPLLIYSGLTLKESVGILFNYATSTTKFTRSHVIL